MKRQNSDFAYLTGMMDVPGAALMLAPGERTYREFLFLPSRNPDMERFEGVNLPIGNEVRRRTGFERVLRSNYLGTTLTEVASRAGAMHYLGPLATPDAAVPRELELYGKVAARVPGTRTVNSAGLVRAMRAAKEPREIALMRKAVAATDRGMRAAMRRRPAGHDRISAAHDHRGRIPPRRRARPRLPVDRRRRPQHDGASLHRRRQCHPRWRHDPLRYRRGGRILRRGRHPHLPGRRPLHPRAARHLRNRTRRPERRRPNLRAGAYYEDLQRAANEVMDRAGHRDDFWHGLGHFVGLDVHDVGDYAKPLPAGAVVTIEPGIYLPERNFGVRIEDEFLVTPNGNEKLSRRSRVRSPRSKPPWREPDPPQGCG